LGELLRPIAKSEVATKTAEAKAAAAEKIASRGLRSSKAAPVAPGGKERYKVVAPKVANHCKFNMNLKALSLYIYIYIYIYIYYIYIYIYIHISIPPT